MKALLTLSFALGITILQAQNFEWANQIGGSGADYGNSVTTDGNGNVYVTGQFEGVVDFESGPGEYFLTSTGKFDMFIAKYNPAAQLVWAVRVGDDGPDGTARSVAIAVGVSGSVYVTGRFSGYTDFDPGAGEHILVTLPIGSCQDLDLFILKLTNNSDFVWVRQIGAPDGADMGETIALGPNEEVHVGGHAASNSNTDVDFDPGPDVHLVDLYPVGAITFLLKLDSDGGFIWVDPFTASCLQASGCFFRHNMVYINGLSVDASGQVFAAGSIQCNTDFDPSPATFHVTPVGGQNSFILKLSASGGLDWVKQFSGNPNAANDITLDGSGNILTTGSFSKTVDFDPGSSIKNLKSFSNSTDIYVSKLNASGNYVWAAQMGGTGYDTGNGVDVDAGGHVYTAGYFAGTADFNPGQAKYNLNAAGLNDIFVAKLNSSAGFVWAVRMGGTASETCNDLDVDASGSVLTTGEFQSTADFNPGSGTYNLTSLGGNDAFVHKMNQSGGAIAPQDGPDVARTMSAFVFPNPTSGIINVLFDHDIDNGRIQLFNLNGQLLLEKNNVVGISTRMDLSTVSNGMYLVRIDDGMESAVVRIYKNE